MHIRRLGVVSCLLLAAFGCAPQRATTQDRLLEVFPERAPMALAIDGLPFVKGDLGFVQPGQGDALATAEAAMQRLSARFPLQGEEAITLSLPGGFQVEVRELEMFDDGTASFGHIQYKRNNGRSFWRTKDSGVEEWLHIVSPEPGIVAQWSIEGASLEQQGDTVVLLDREGREQIQITAPEAWGASGAPIPVRLEAEGSLVSLLIDEEAALEEELLIDPIWSPVGAMTVSRRLFTATALSNGKVLVAGGLGSNGAPLASCELYDPATGLWTPVQAMQTARSQHTAVLLKNGNVFVTGGRDANNQPLAASEYYVPSNNLWVGVQWMATARSGHTATLLPSGKVLVAGGGTTASELFTPSAGTWSLTNGPMNAVRSWHSATKLSGGRVLVVGGVAAGYLSSAEIFTESTGTWQATNPMPGPRASHTATLLRNGLVLVAGGRSSAFVYQKTAYLFNPSNQTWTQATSMVTERTGHTATLLPNDRVLVVGGSNSNGALATYEVYTPNGAWSSVAALSPRMQHVAVLLESGRVLIAGGYHNGALFTSELYNPAYANDSWRFVGAIPFENTPWNEGFTGTATLLPSGMILLVGTCWTNAPPEECRATLYNPATGVSTPTGPMGWKTWGHAASLMMDGRVLVAGGHLTQWAGGNAGWYDLGFAASGQIYNPTTNSWSTTSNWEATPSSDSWEFGRHSATATLLPSGHVLVVGGQGLREDGFGWYYWLPQAQAYEPTTNTWQALENIPGRFGHTANLTNNGKVLISGGSPGFFVDQFGSGFDPCINGAGLFDPATWQYTNSNPMQDERCNHTGTLTPDGRVVVTGGRAFADFGGVVPSIEAFKTSIQTWNFLGNLGAPRWLHTATLLPNGTVMLTGGIHDTAPLWPTTTEIFEPALNQSITSPNLDHASWLVPTLLLPDNRVLQIGFCTLNQVDVTCSPRTQVWAYDEGRLATTAPGIVTIPANLSPGASITITGANFIPDQESTQGAATNTPTVIFQRQESENRVTAPLTSFTETSATLTVPSTMLKGWYQVRVVVNGIPSAAKIVRVN